MNSHRDQFDKEYFENGIISGRSLYENYRWIPQIAFERATLIKSLFPNSKVLDFGCAKGYVVHALRLLSTEAYGYDISDYAIDNCKEECKGFIFRENEKHCIPNVDLVYSKDVLEHVPKELLECELSWIRNICSKAFFLIPLGENGRYRIPEYAFDKTHVIIENEEWWCQQFITIGFIVTRFEYQIAGFKDRWFNHDRYGNGFFFLESKK